MSIVLDTTTKSLQVSLGGAVASNQLPCVASWADMSGSTFTAGSNDSQSNGATAVTVVSSPASSTQRQVKAINIYNADTAAAAVTVAFNDNATIRTLVNITLQTGETLQYAENAWTVINNSGAIIESVLTQSSGPAGGDLSGTYPNPTVAKLNGIAAPSSAPSGSGQVLTSTSTSATSWQSPPVATVFGRSGAVAAASADYTAAQVTNAADKSSSSAQTFTGNVIAPAIIASGLTGATSSSRYVGATTSGAPTSGTFSTGDFIIDQTGVIWICTTGGTSGTWAKASIALDTTSSDIQAPGSQAAGSTGKAADAGHVHAASFTATAYVAPAISTLTFGSSIAINAALGNVFSVTLTASTGTFANPTNPTDGQVMRIRVTQGSGGSFTLAYGSAYDFGTVGAPTLSTTAAKVDVLGFEYVSSISKWCYLGSGLGF